MVNPGKDVAFALRMLVRNPGFTFVVASTLALGIGVNTAIFSIVDGVLLKPLPFREPDRLAMVWQKSTAGVELGVSELDLDDYVSRNHVFEHLGGFTVPGTKSVILTGDGAPIELAPAYITRNLFSTLGIAPTVGRNFLPEECQRGRNQVVILSHALWQSRFAGAPDILDHQITLNGQKLQVVGVMGDNAYPAEAEVFLPFTRISPLKPLPRNYHELNVVGRLSPGRTIADAQREMGALAGDLSRSYSTTNGGIGVYILPLNEEITGKVRDPLLVLLFAAGLVLLIACGNVANLLLVRAAARQKEIAIRVAMGAARTRVIIQFITECLVLSTIGTLFGLILAWQLMPLIRFLGSERIPRLQHAAIDARVLLFTVALTVLTALFFGLIPALWNSSANLNLVLRAGGRTSRSESARVRNALVTIEVALALAVIVGASLLVRSLNQLLQVQPGFRADHVLLAKVALPATRYRQSAIQDFYNRLLPRIAAIPGVLSVSVSTDVPLASPVKSTRFQLSGSPVNDPQNYPVTAFASVDPDFFTTMAIPVVRGRTFRREEIGNERDERCMVNTAFTRAFLNGQDPIGRTILTNVAETPQESCQIVGVVGDTRIGGLDKPTQPVLYFSAYVAKEFLVIRTSTEPLSVVPAIQHELAMADPEQPLSSVSRMSDVLSRSLSRRSFAAVLLAIFSGLGLLLAALGLYGMIAYSVAQRTQEIGVRMSLGAEPRTIFRLIMTQGLAITGVGLAVGLAAAALLTRTMSSLLFGVGAADPLSYVAGCVLLTAVSALACYVPARRATRVDPLVALRYE